MHLFSLPYQSSRQTKLLVHQPTQKQLYTNLFCWPLVSSDFIMMMFPWTEYESTLKKVTTIILNLLENHPVSAQQMLIASRETSQLLVPSLNKSLCFSRVCLQSGSHTFKQNSFAEDLFFWNNTECVRSGSCFTKIRSVTLSLSLFLSP